MAIQLNSQQQAVVDAITGPCLVIAGAGSGKTRVIITKIRNLIENGIPDSGVYAVTFTNKAAHEMQERLQLDIGKNKVQVSTFHTLGLNIIKAEHKLFRLKQKVILSDPHDQRVLLRDIMQYMSLSFPVDEAIEMSLTFISHCKNLLLLPGDLPPNPKEITSNPNFINNYQFFATVYKYYFAYMQSISMLDFDDLIMLPTTLLKHNAKARAKYQRKIQYLLVDEYQDTNTVQYELVKLLVGDRQNFTVVGDDDQSIYSWRGAQPENLVNLQQDFPNLKVFLLEQNYRSTGTIIEAANHLIAHNPHIYDKKLKSTHEQGKKILVVPHTDADEEAYETVQAILDHRFNHKTKFGDYCVLYRSNHQSRLIEKHMSKEEVPCVVAGDSSFFEKSEIKDYIAYLRVLSNIDDDKALLRIINIPRRNIGNATIAAIGDVAREHNISFYDACTHPDLMERIKGKTFVELQEFLDMLIQTSDAINATNDFNILQDFFNELGYDQFLLEQGENLKVVEVQIENTTRLMGWIKNWMADDEFGAMSLAEICQHLFLREMSANKAKEDGSEFVQLMTIHASKGLEFPYVHLIGCEEEQIPHKASIEDGNIEEERRLMYVGITRAQKELTLHYSLTRKQDGVEMETELSRFVEEIPEAYLEFADFDPVLAKEKREQRNNRAIDDILAEIDMIVDDD